MATKTVALEYRKDDGAGGTTPITGATAFVKVVRLADGYVYDSVTSAFVAAGATNPALVEVGATGLYTLALTVTAWDNGLYHTYAQAGKAGESPYGLAEIWTVYGGTVAGAAPSAPAAASTCRVYLYFDDIPATSPTITVTYAGNPVTATNAFALSPTPVYNSTTGLWYVDLIYGATATIACLLRGLHKTFLVPSVTTVAYPSLEGVQ